MQTEKEEYKKLIKFMRKLSCKTNESNKTKNQKILSSQKNNDDVGNIGQFICHDKFIKNNDVGIMKF